jgi:hypothetical protein
MTDVDLIRGSWRLVSFEARRSSGEIAEPFGPDADGVLTYSPDGRVSVAVWAAGRRRFTLEDPAKGTAEENAAALSTIVQYVGTYEVDPAGSAVVHHVEQSVFPNWNGVDQVRYYSLSADSLELTTPPIEFKGETLVSALVWRRISSL